MESYHVGDVMRVHLVQVVVVDVGISKVVAVR